MRNQEEEDVGVEGENGGLYNQEYSMELGAQPCYLAYREWLIKNGAIISPKIIYPAYFGKRGSGIIGIGTKQPLSTNQPLIAIPYSLIITPQKCRDDPKIRRLVQETSCLSKQHNSQFLYLALYLLQELCLEQKSLYYPYLQICMKNNIEKWSHWDMLAIQDAAVFRDIKQQHQRVNQLLQFIQVIKANLYGNKSQKGQKGEMGRRKIKEGMEQQGWEFLERVSNQQLEDLVWRVYFIISTRSFGWPLPSRSLIPFADGLNHSNSNYITHQLIHFPNPPKTITPFSTSLRKPTNPQKKSRIQRFLKKHKSLTPSPSSSLPVTQSQQFYNILRQQYQNGRTLSSLHTYDDSCDEDNDTDEEQTDRFQDLVDLFFKQELAGDGVGLENITQYLIRFWNLYLDPGVQCKPMKNNGQNQQQHQSESSEQEADNPTTTPSPKSCSSSQLSSTSSQQQQPILPTPLNPLTTYFLVHTPKSPLPLLPLPAPGSQFRPQQLYNFYGRRSNKFLLVGYSFILDNNKYDSFSLRLMVPNWKKSTTCFQNVVPAAQIVARFAKAGELYTREIRLKRGRVQVMLVELCRAIVVGWRAGQGEAKVKYKIMLPTCRDLERQALDLSIQILTHIYNSHLTTLQQDNKFLQTPKTENLKHATKLRIIQKKILLDQINLLQQCKEYLDSWCKATNKINIKDDEEMRKICKIKEYLILLEKANI